MDYLPEIRGATMSVVRLDESIVPILENATERVVIRAKDGRVLGYFEPAAQMPQGRQSPYTDDEVREFQRNKGECMSLEEFWKKMGVQ
jgi:hypothetical protein